LESLLLKTFIDLHTTYGGLKHEQLELKDYHALSFYGLCVDLLKKDATALPPFIEIGPFWYLQRQQQESIT
jgi:hypothetical protein